jgi:RNA polymerase sigma-70 factor, ECF subfamily
MVQSFEDYRTYLFAIAYRMLGSAMDAEDMVQEAYLRFQATPPETQQSIVSLKAYLTTIITRLCVNQLNSAHRKREEYVGPWLPEPISTDRAPESVNPEERMELYESLSLAFLVLLEELQPIERAVFLLRDVFDYEYAEIAAFLGKSEAACRQAFSRAKKHLADHRPRFTPSPETQREMLSSFLRAVQGGDMDGLMTMLADDVTLWADGGGKVRGAATRLPDATRWRASVCARCASCRRAIRARSQRSMGSRRWLSALAVAPSQSSPSRWPGSRSEPCASSPTRRSSAGSSC